MTSSHDHGIASVSYNGMVWTPGEEAWAEPDPEADGEAQVLEVADSTAVIISISVPE